MTSTRWWQADAAAWPARRRCSQRRKNNSRARGRRGGGELRCRRHRGEVTSTRRKAGAFSTSAGGSVAGVSPMRVGDAPNGGGGECLTRARARRGREANAHTHTQHTGAAEDGLQSPPVELKSILGVRAPPERGGSGATRPHARRGTKEAAVHTGAAVQGGWREKGATSTRWVGGPQHAAGRGGLCRQSAGGGGRCPKEEWLTREREGPRGTAWARAGSRVAGEPAATVTRWRGSARTLAATATDTVAAVAPRARVAVVGGGGKSGRTEERGPGGRGRAGGGRRAKGTADHRPLGRRRRQSSTTDAPHVPTDRLAGRGEMAGWSGRASGTAQYGRAESVHG